MAKLRRSSEKVGEARAFHKNFLEGGEYGFLNFILQYFYQICKDDEIIFSIENDGKNIDRYNFLVVPFGYLVVIVASLFLELLIIQKTMRIKT